MLREGPAWKVTIHLNEDSVGLQDFVYREVFSFLYASGVAGATMFRPVAGFGSHHHVHEYDHGNAGEEKHLPVRIEFIESEARARELLAGLSELVTDGVVEVQETRVFRVAVNGSNPS